MPISSTLRHLPRTTLVLVALLGAACDVDGELPEDLDGDGELDGAVEPDGVEQLEPVALNGCSRALVLSQTPPERRPYIDRAMRWVDLRVGYSQSATFEGYRRDCSGFLSMAWGLPRPGANTSGFAPASGVTSHAIPRSALVPGDALNIPGEHTMIFGGWAPGGVMCVLQENRTGTPANLAGYGAGYYGRFTAIRSNTAPTGPAPGAPAGCGIHNEGWTLPAGASVTSCNGVFRLAMQTDGNLVLYRGGTALWHTATQGTDSRAVLQTDGNFVVYGSGRALWWTATQGSGTYLGLQDDGNLVVYSAYRTPLWHR